MQTQRKNIIKREPHAKVVVATLIIGIVDKERQGVDDLKAYFIESDPDEISREASQEFCFGTKT